MEIKIQTNQNSLKPPDMYNIKLKDNSKSKLDDLVDKRILFAFNMANNFRIPTRLFHKYKVWTDIVSQMSESIISSTGANPLSEDPDFPKRHLFVWDSRLSSSPMPLTKILIYTYEYFRSFFFNHLNYTYLGRLARSYDIVISSNQNRFFYGHKHSIVYDLGAIRSLGKQRKFYARMEVKAYKNAELVIFVNPDTLPLFHKIGVSNPQFIPLLGDHTKYTPLPKKETDMFTILAPARQNWRVKASHHLIHAFASASKNSKMQLVVTEWGVDINRTKALVKKLKIEHKVKYVPFANKNKLIERINNADVVADQFGYGTYPLTSIEAMACAKPVLVYINVDTNKQCFGKMPPVLNCQSIQSIEKQILEIYSNRKKGRSIGKKAREWIKEKHNPQTIFEQYIDIIHNSLIK